jgi:hypothetical protein
MAVHRKRHRPRHNGLASCVAGESQCRAEFAVATGACHQGGGAQDVELRASVVADPAPGIGATLASRMTLPQNGR